MSWAGLRCDRLCGGQDDLRDLVFGLPSIDGVQIEKQGKWVDCLFYSNQANTAMVSTLSAGPPAKRLTLGWAETHKVPISMLPLQGGNM